MNWIVNIDDVFPIFAQHTPAHIFRGGGKTDERRREMAFVHPKMIIRGKIRWPFVHWQSFTFVLVKPERWRFLSFIMAAWRMFFLSRNSIPEFPFWWFILSSPDYCHSSPTSSLSSWLIVLGRTKLNWTELSRSFGFFFLAISFLHRVPKPTRDGHKTGKETSTLTV